MVFAAALLIKASTLPADDSMVVGRSRTVTMDAEERELRALRAKLAQEPTDASLTTEFARRCIRKSREDSNPRYLGYADAALRQWFTRSRTPADILVLRATIRQSNHEFDPALSDLDQALRIDPANAQAWLTRAAILQVQGRFDEAKHASLRLVGSTSELVAVTAACGIASLTGQAAKSYDMLARALERSAAVSTDERLWALTVLAEIAVRSGRNDDAERAFNLARDIGRRDGYLLGAYADFLLDQNRNAEVIRLLAKETEADGLLLRLALAEKASINRPASYDSHIRSLESRFAAGRRRGERVHLREEAVFRMHLKGEPVAALAVAEENWRIQKEPADARILLECALATGQIERAGPSVEWLKASRLEDVRLQLLIARLEAGDAD